MMRLCYINYYYLNIYYQYYYFEGYLKKAPNYPKRIILSNLTHMMSMVDLVAITINIPRIIISLRRDSSLN